MKIDRGGGNHTSFFRGWYFKHQKNGNTVSFIPGIQRDKSGAASAFIQIITNDKSYYIKYPYNQLKVHPKELYIKIGNNVFSKKGIKVNIQCPNIQVKGTIRYDELLPIRYDIMGPLCLIPGMKSKHGIYSMRHGLHGTLQFNGKDISFDNGLGYIESDEGNSFPKTYFWTHCNDFKKRACSIVVAVADINIVCKRIRGCFAVIHYKGKEYRLATYLGARVVVLSSEKVCIKQGRYILYISSLNKNQKGLKAPVNGKMNRTIYEDVSCHAQYRLYKSGKKFFDLSSDHASLEFTKG